MEVHISQKPKVVAGLKKKKGRHLRAEHFKVAQELGQMLPQLVGKVRRDESKAATSFPPKNPRMVANIDEGR